MYDRAQYPPDPIASVQQAEFRDAAPRKFYRTIGKRILDVGLVLAILPILIPLIIVLAVFVRRDGGPAFFLHERIGRGGKPFKCIKLRTMVVDAERRLIAHLNAHPDEKAHWERNFKLEDDPRITPVGRILRKLSLDELPQFFNVLAGHMSIVGPRPITRPELAFYADQRHVLLSVLPGVTGPWQVRGRNRLSFVDRVQLDLGYVRDHDLTGDLKLILSTITVSLRGTGL